MTDCNRSQEALRNILRQTTPSKEIFQEATLVQEEFEVRGRNLLRGTVSLEAVFKRLGSGVFLFRWLGMFHGGSDLKEVAVGVDDLNSGEFS